MNSHVLCSCGVTLQRATTNGSVTYSVQPGACRHCRIVAVVRANYKNLTVPTRPRWSSFTVRVLQQAGGAFLVVALLWTTAWCLMSL